ncbi:MAG: hypothetical protein GX951_04955 [Mollicutes bacterium]|nr:hypothetical protein [Mollicutes bacterium]
MSQPYYLQSEEFNRHFQSDEDKINQYKGLLIELLNKAINETSTIDEATYNELIISLEEEMPFLTMTSLVYTKIEALKDKNNFKEGGYSEGYSVILDEIFDLLNLNMQAYRDNRPVPIIPVRYTESSIQR